MGRKPDTYPVSLRRNLGALLGPGGPESPGGGHDYVLSLRRNEGTGIPCDNLTERGPEEHLKDPNSQDMTLLFCFLLSILQILHSLRLFCLYRERFGPSHSRCVAKEEKSLHLLQSLARPHAFTISSPLPPTKFFFDLGEAAGLIYKKSIDP